MKKINMKEKIPKITLIKRIIYIILAVVIVGIGIQQVYNFVSGEMIKVKSSYVTIDGKQIHYKAKGTGDYTVVFSGDTGANMYEWNKTVEDLESSGVRTFVYNRNGYGLSSGSEKLTPQEQAEQLHTLLKKSATGGNYILVGEGYGSLVMTNYAKLYPDNVKGVVLVDPINEANKNKYHTTKAAISLAGKKIQAIGANCSLTWILNKIGLTTNYPDFEKNLVNEKEKNQYDWLKNQAPYRNAIYNESKNLYDMNSNSQTKGMFGNIPYYLITNEKDSGLKDLGSESYTTEYYVDYNGDAFASTNPRDVAVAVNKVIDQATRIRARENNK
ncbi:MAG: alpha/beta fold hydrolase [Clostridium sp.]